MKKLIAITLAVLLISCVCLTGCLGGGAKTEISQSDQSLGQELIDLQKARESGAITEKEYNAAKKKLLKKK